MRRPSRKPCNLSESLQRKLNSYALAASTAGVGVLALSQPADAKVIYTRTHKTIRLGQYYNLDLNHSGIPEIRIQFTSLGSASAHDGTLSAIPLDGNAVAGGKNYAWAYALRQGAVIGRPKQPFVGTANALMLWVGTTGGRTHTPVGYWSDVKNRYLGLRIYFVGGENRPWHYGWARLSVDSTQKSITSATVTGYAYESIPYKPIIAGKTKGPDVITVEPGSLGHLAHGASAIPVWRTKQ
jgi:hypothetical protein